MKKSYSLKTRLIISMALLVLVQSLALTLALSFSQVFVMLDAEAFRLFNNTTSARTVTFDTHVGSLVSNMAEATNSLNTSLTDMAKKSNVPAKHIATDNLLYSQAVLDAAEVLIEILYENSVTGAFFVLNSSNANPQDPNAHSSVYIRNSTPGEYNASNSSLLLEVGPIALSSEYQVTTSISWDLDVRFSQDPEQSAFFYKPFLAAEQIKRAEIERYGYWSAPGSILDNNQQAVYYTMPLIDQDGNAYGILGIEISLVHFTQEYLPNIDLPYQNSFYAIAAMSGDNSPIDWFIPSGPLAQVYLQSDTQLEFSPLASTDLHTTQLEGLGPMYCSIQPVTIYSRNSPFIHENWSLIGFVSQASLHESSSSVRNTLVISIVITTALAFAAIFFLVYLSTRKISGLSAYVNSLSPTQDIHFQRTGLREIDELTSAVEKLNQNVINASKTTSRILELSLLPIGGFEVSTQTHMVNPTEFICRLLEIPAGTTLTIPQWEEHFQNLTAQPFEEYENVYKYQDVDGYPLWLRILTTATDSGIIGVVLDVTKDIEERMRMAHELDYDTLTQLYNRRAFRREAELKIEAQPEKIGAMIFADLDNLKYINDTFGHDIGDRLIIRAGEMFRQFSSIGGVVARFSGDEYAIYLHGFDSQEEARTLIHHQFKVNETYSLTTPDGSAHRVRCSSGIAWYPQDSTSISDLLRLSDFAMYEAKNTRKGTIFEFSNDSYKKNAYLFENREAIYRLLDDALIRFAFQPIVDLRTGEIFAYEALMRPMLEDFKSPLEVLNMAAAQSKLGQLERLVMMTAMQAIFEREKEFGHAKVFINSIPSQVLSSEDHMLLKRRYEGIFNRVVIEITEAENDSPQQLESKVNFFRECGMQLAIDDFGSGYSNEIRILSMQPNIVKIDIGMIQGIHENVDKQQLVSNIISFCHPKGIKLIAEGVEDIADLAELIRLDMDYVQGYFTGRPAFEIGDISDGVKKQILELQTDRMSVY